MGPFTRILLTLTLPTIGLLGLAALAEDNGALHINPFKRPLLEQPVADSAAAGNAASVPAAPPLILEATILGSRTPLARISGRIVAVGETVDGYSVKSIRSGEVTLSKNAQSLVLRLEAPGSLNKAEHD